MTPGEPDDPGMTESEEDRGDPEVPGVPEVRGGSESEVMPTRCEFCGKSHASNVVNLVGEDGSKLRVISCPSVPYDRPVLWDKEVWIRGKMAATKMTDGHMAEGLVLPS